MNVSISDVAWDQASLPILKGGMGIRETAELAFPAFWAAIHAVYSLVSLFTTLPNDADSKLAEIEWLDISSDGLPTQTSRHVQKVWDDAFVKRKFERVFNELGCWQFLRLNHRNRCTPARRVSVGLSCLIPVFAMCILLDWSSGLLSSHMWMRQKGPRRWSPWPALPKKRRTWGRIECLNEMVRKPSRLLEFSRN